MEFSSIRPLSGFLFRVAEGAPGRSEQTWVTSRLLTIDTSQAIRYPSKREVKCAINKLSHKEDSRIKPVLLLKQKSYFAYAYHPRVRRSHMLFGTEAIRRPNSDLSVKPLLPQEKCPAFNIDDKSSQRPTHPPLHREP
jgi:hypothetical protein